MAQFDSCFCALVKPFQSQRDHKFSYIIKIDRVYAPKSTHCFLGEVFLDTNERICPRRPSAVMTLCFHLVALTDSGVL